jgi:hexosaminidase
MSKLYPHDIRTGYLLQLCCLILFLVFGCENPPSVPTREVQLIPQPVSLEKKEGGFALNNSVGISIPADQPLVAKGIESFVAKVKVAAGINLSISEGGNQAITLSLNEQAQPELGEEGYQLEITNKDINLRANKAAGLFYGIQTLYQLLPNEIESATQVDNVHWVLPAVSITDYPRFAWRGLMLDVSRHFFTKEEVKQYIDQMTRLKYNRFHWHLTDDNGWRVEIKSFPKLTEVGAWRVERFGTFGRREDPKQGEPTPYGGFYTQDDIREVVQYAKDRNIEILPEIDVPGHSMAAIAAYPELSITKDKAIKVNPGTPFSTWYGDGKFEMHIDNTLNPTDEKVYEFMDKVFTEIAALFPFEYIHMGGDECYKGYWERSPVGKAFMKEKGIKNGEGLQAYFNDRVNQIIESKNKKMIGWDEILEGGIAPGAAVMSWRGIKGGIEASHMKHQVVISPNPVYYLDMNQGEKSIEPPIYNTARLKDVYLFDILPPEIDSAYVLGGQGNLWTEQIPTLAQANYMTFPRALAIAESMWTPKKKKDWNSFVARVENQFNRYDVARVHYATSMYDPIINVKNKNGKTTIAMQSEVPGIDMYYTLDNTLPSVYSPVYKDSVVFPQGADQLRVQSYRSGKPIGRLITLSKEALSKK